MGYTKIVSLTFFISISILGFCQTQGRSIGRSDSKKILNQEKQSDELKKSNGEKYGNKEVSVEINVDKLINIELNNNNRTIEVKTWDESKIKISTIVYFDGTMSTLSSESWFDKLNIKTKLLSNTLRITTEALASSNVNNSNGSTNSISSQEVVEVYSVDGQYIKSEPAKRKMVTIYVPKENKLSIESKYADVAVVNYIKKLKADITNGNLEIDHVNTISLKSKYANVYIGDVQSGSIDFINGKLSIGTLGNIDLETKYATVEISKVKKLIFKSTNDDYELEDVIAIEGSKSYGSLQIEKLIESIQIEGINADAKIKNISSEIKSIWFDNKYAELRLPLKNVANFSLNYEGVYSTISKSFITGDNDSQRVSTSDDHNAKYNATVGSGLTKINIKCQNCKIDFR